MVRTLTAVVMAMCLASVAASAPARAATPTDDTDNKKEYRYELLKDKNGAPLLDEKGKIQILDKMTGMILAVTGSEMAELNSRNEKSLLQRPKDETVKGLEKKNTPPKISIPDQEKDSMTLINLDSPTVLTDLHRRNSEPDISDYKNHLSYNQVVYIRNGQIEGHISLKNTGIHKIADMEVTLVVPTADGNSERYRYRLTTENDIPFVTRPPLPKGRMVIFPVKEKAPIGAGTAQNEKIRTEITYIRFADD
ncbi:MAG: hypothetical protein L6R28_23545 [Planctomycetes bacterium]|nr:hypothetical protein [Planctomycetota bacterium]